MSTVKQVILCHKNLLYLGNVRPKLPSAHLRSVVKDSGFVCFHIHVHGKIDIGS